MTGLFLCVVVVLFFAVCTPLVMFAPCFFVAFLIYAYYIDAKLFCCFGRVFFVVFCCFFAKLLLFFVSLSVNLFFADCVLILH